MSENVPQPPSDPVPPAVPPPIPPRPLPELASLPGMPELPRHAPAPPPKGRPARRPGRMNVVFIVLSVVGMIVFSPILYQLRYADPDTLYPFTPTLLWNVLGFLFSMVLFAAFVGVRVVFWVSEWFVDLIFSTHGGAPTKTTTHPEDEWLPSPRRAPTAPATPSSAAHLATPPAVRSRRAPVQEPPPPGDAR
jgi:hypothetical protein